MGTRLFGGLAMMSAVMLAAGSCSSSSTNEPGGGAGGATTDGSSGAGGSSGAAGNSATSCNETTCPAQVTCCRNALPNGLKPVVATLVNHDLCTSLCSGAGKPCETTCATQELDAPCLYCVLNSEADIAQKSQEQCGFDTVCLEAQQCLGSICID